MQNKIRYALETILHHLQRTTQDADARSELRCAFDVLAEAFEEMEQTKETAHRLSYEASVRANGGIPD